MLGISSKTLDVLLKYPGVLHRNSRRQVMLFKPGTVYEACVQAQYLEMHKKKGQPNGSKQTNQQGASKEGKKK
jgi:hypothetical protein